MKINWETGVEYLGDGLVKKPLVLSCPQIFPRVLHALGIA